jgi:cellobiose phosphorylase
MDKITANNGQVVTTAMIDKWAESLDADKWPSGWKNVGEIQDGLPQTSPANTETLSIKLPAAMKVAVINNARVSGKSTSAFVRGIIENSLVCNA